MVLDVGILVISVVVVGCLYSVVRVTEIRLLCSQDVNLILYIIMRVGHCVDMCM